MIKTARGLAVSTHSSDVINSIDHFSEQMLRAGLFAADILEAAPLHPDNVLIQTYSAAFYLYSQEHQTNVNAVPYLLQAEQHLKSANLREQLIYQAVRAWQRLDYEGALSILSSVVHLFPNDILALKFAEWLFYCKGQFYQGKRYLALCEQSAPRNQHDPHFLAMNSFALELCQHFDQAIIMAKKAAFN